MSDSLARLQASKTDMVPQRTVETCLAQGLVKRVQELNDELVELQIAAFRSDADEDASNKPRRKMAQGRSPRIDEITAELETLADEMREHTGRVTVARTISLGKWRLWADENPAREDGHDAKGHPLFHPFDLAVTGGYCDGTALLERLGDFVTEWNGEPLTAGQWDWLSEKMPPGDQKQAAREVIDLYEVKGARAAPKSPSDSSRTTPKSPDSASPENAASQGSGASDGSPPSDTSTSPPTGP